MNKDTKVKILSAAKAELMKHSLDTFVDAPPSVAEGGRGVVVTGCPNCRKIFQWVNQLMYHLADDVLDIAGEAGELIKAHARLTK